MLATLPGPHHHLLLPPPFPVLFFLPLLCSRFYSSFFPIPPLSCLLLSSLSFFLKIKQACHFSKVKVIILETWKVRILPICLLCKGRWPKPSILGLFHSLGCGAEDGCTEQIWKTGMTEKRQDEFGVVTTCTVVARGTCTVGARSTCTVGACAASRAMSQI